MRPSAETAPVCGIVAVVIFGSIVAGCSDIYYDRRETILFGADDAVASNIAVQTIDPWPPHVENRRPPANGERVAAAIKRYRTGRVLTPIGNDTSSSYQQQQQLQQQMMQDPPAASGTGASSATTPTAGGMQVK